MVSRNSSGHFIKGCGLPQTFEGWIDKYVRESERKLIGKIGIKPLIDKRYKQRVLQDPVKHARSLEIKRKSHECNKEADNLRTKTNYHKDPYKYSLKFKQYYKKNREWLVANQYDYYWNRGGREIAMEYARNNPKSGGGSDSIEALIAMNMARQRDGNRCQWGGCDKKCDEVNHIFSRAKYPEYEAELWNLISYCFDHHIKWHEMKGELGAAALIKANRDRKMVLNVYNN